MSSNKTILAIDDDKNNIMLLEAIVGSLGFRVMSTNDPVKGIEMAETLNPSVILMDLQMPEVDGIEATSRLKAAPATADIPIIILTGSVDKDLHRRAFEAGCSVVLLKPVRVGELHTHLMQHLGIGT